MFRFNSLRQQINKLIKLKESFIAVRRLNILHMKMLIKTSKNLNFLCSKFNVLENKEKNAINFHS